MAVSKRLRFEVLRRDNYQCRYCGAKPPETALRVDHVVPEALGGRAEPTNLVTSCEPCNNGKSSVVLDSPTVDDVAQDALRWADAMRVAAENALAERDLRQECYDAFHTEWHEYTVTSGIKKFTVPLPPDWESTVDRLLTAGLPMPLLIDCIRIAMGAKGVPSDRCFNYMCGVAWRKVNELQGQARLIVDVPDNPAPVQPRPVDQLVGALESYFQSLDYTTYRRAERTAYQEMYGRHGDYVDSMRVELLVEILHQLTDQAATSRETPV